MVLPIVIAVKSHSLAQEGFRRGPAAAAVVESRRATD